jgi:hypothetical protein
LPADFLERYKNVASDDIAGFLFATNATSVLSIDTTKDFPPEGVRETGYRMGPYLRGAGIRHLLIFCVQSSFDIAWLALYRMNDKPFTVVEAETASYLGRAALFAWQKATQPASAQKAISPNRYKLVKINHSWVQVAVRLARGYTAPEIKDELGGSLRTIEDCVRDCLEAFSDGDSKSRRHISDRLLGELPKQRGKLVEQRKIDRANLDPGASASSE